MLVILFASNLTQYLGSGPNYPKDGFEPSCKESWWTNLLYINNLVKIDQLVNKHSFINYSTNGFLKSILIEFNIIISVSRYLLIRILFVCD